MLEDTRRRLAAQDVTIEFGDAAIDLLARQGFQPEFGARPLRRTIQRQLDNRLSAMLLAGTIDPGSHLRVDVQDGELSFHAEPPPTGDAATVSHAQEAETPTSQRMTA